jgi:hypothetical protein
MPEMYGKEQYTIYLDKINSGSNTRTWKNLSANMSKHVKYSRDGWNGLLGKKHGILTLNCKKEWGNHKMLKGYCIAIFRHILV